MNSKSAELENCMGPLWQPKLWEEINNQEYLKHTNCYSYAFNYIDYGEEKLQPGEIHGTKYKKTTCDEIIQKMKNDYVNDTIEKTSLQEVLSIDRYKIALFIDLDKQRKNTNDHDQDYHFYRQDCPGTWSHKSGTNVATNEDASGNAITDPEKADKNYEKKCIQEGGKECKDEHNYQTLCGYFSVLKNSLDGPVLRFVEREGNGNNGN
jgi:hypothetical protein